jgi:hypothetical protein
LSDFEDLHPELAMILPVRACSSFSQERINNPIKNPVRKRKIAFFIYLIIAHLAIADEDVVIISFDYARHPRIIYFIIKFTPCLD